MGPSADERLAGLTETERASVADYVGFLASRHRRSRASVRELNVHDLPSAGREVEVVADAIEVSGVDGGIDEIVMFAVGKGEKLAGEVA